MSQLDAKLHVGNESQAVGHYTFGIKKCSDQLVLTFPDGIQLGLLNTHVAKALKDIVELSSVQFEALADIGKLRELIGRVTKASDAVARVNIYIYGSREARKGVGRHLSSNKVYLQRPDQQRYGTRYDNPHVLKLPQMQMPSINYQPDATGHKMSQSDNVEHFRKAVSDVYASLKRSSRLERLEGARLKTSLLPYVPSCSCGTTSFTLIILCHEEYLIHHHASL